MNLLALAVSRIDPEAGVFAGDRFSEAKALGSIWQAFGVTDSLELHDDELGTDDPPDGGSSLREILQTE